MCENELCLLVRKSALARGCLGQVAYLKLKKTPFLHFSARVSVVSFPFLVCFTALMLFSVINILHSHRTLECLYPPEAQ